MPSWDGMTSLVAKLVDVAEKVEAGFAAIIGTPVPAVIGTDHQALRRMCEKKSRSSGACSKYQRNGAL